MSDCPRCALLEARLEAQLMRVDRLTEIVFALSAHKVTGSSTVPHLREEDPRPVPDPFPPKVMQAILDRSDPNTPARRDLMTRAREMLDAGVGAGDVETHVLNGAELEL